LDISPLTVQESLIRYCSDGSRSLPTRDRTVSGLITKQLPHSLYWAEFRDSVGKQVAECQNILGRAAARDDDDGDNWNSEP